MYIYIYIIQTFKRMSTPCLSFKEVDLAIYDKTLKVSLPTSGRVMERENTKEEKIQRL